MKLPIKRGRYKINGVIVISISRRFDCVMQNVYGWNDYMFKTFFEVFRREPDRKQYSK